MAYLLIAAAMFGVIYLIDKGLTRLLRSREQHRSGTAVRLKKGYGVAALVLMLLGVLALMQYAAEKSGLFLLCGLVILPTGALLGIYYLTHGVFYDDETFLYTTFGTKSVTYRYRDIRGQKLYVIQGGGYVVELYMQDGKTVSIQTGMEGALTFLDKAAHARMRQLGLNSHECAWFDETKSCWFPPVEE